jgi:glucose/arabinose dehydrogenase
MQRVLLLWLCAASIAATAPAVASAQTCTATTQSVLVTSAVSNPVDIRNCGDDRLFIVEQAGSIRILQNGTLLATDFLNLTGIVVSGGERGLLSMAFHPNYPSTPWFFVYYTNGDSGAGGIGDVVIARYSLSSDPNVADPSSGHILIVIPHSSADNHNGGQLQFSPHDGYLYASIGDGGGGCASVAPGCNSQRDDLLLGKLIRIDVNRTTAPYYNIPPSNPFAAPGNPRDEIWAKGLRNPFRMSFDRQTGDLWIGDVGESTREEVDFQPAADAGGRNYGWSIMEGFTCNTCDTSACPAPVPACNAANLTLPVHDYGRSVGTTVIGGYVYRGNQIPALRGCYVFGDYGGGRAVWSLDPASPSTHRSLLDVDGLTTFGEDRTGELYFAASGGIYRLAGTGALVPASSSLGGVALAVGLLLVGLARRGRSAFVKR